MYLIRGSSGAYALCLPIRRRIKKKKTKKKKAERVCQELAAIVQGTSARTIYLVLINSQKRQSGVQATFIFFKAGSVAPAAVEVSDSVLAST